MADAVHVPHEAHLSLRWATIHHPFRHADILTGVCCTTRLFILETPASSSLSFSSFSYSFATATSPKHPYPPSPFISSPPSPLHSPFSSLSSSTWPLFASHHWPQMDQACGLCSISQLNNFVSPTQVTLMSLSMHLIRHTTADTVASTTCSSICLKSLVLL